MRILTVLRRRVGAHPVALVAIALSVLTSMLVVASLQLIIGRISGQGVDQVLAADVAQRSVAVRGTVALDEIQAADDAVRQGLLRLGPGTTVSRVVSTTVRGIEGRGESDRAQVAEAEISTATELVTGAWPQRAGEVVVPEGTATELDLAPGDRLRLVDLVRDHAPDRAAGARGADDHRGDDPRSAVPHDGRPGPGDQGRHRVRPVKAAVRMAIPRN